MARRVEGKVAFVTGLARGQGRSHALRLAQEGADIIGIDMCAPVETVDYEMPTLDDLAETESLIEKLDRRVFARQVDVRDFGGVKKAVDDGVAEFGRLDIVAASAGISSYGMATEITEKTWQEMLDVNLTGVWHTTKAAIPHMIAGGRGGSIVLTSSALGIKAMTNTAHYNSAKFGVVGLMKSLALELGEHSIRVNSVHPTGVKTPMLHNDAVFRLFRPDLENPTVDDLVAPCVSMNVLPIPWVEPVDISNAILFLSSDEARYITGVSLPVDAGFVIK